MARPVDIKKKIEELRGYLIKYNGIPKQTENHAAHNNIKYYIKNHNDNPEIKTLIEEFHLNDVKQRNSKEHFETRIVEILTILEKYHRIPRDNKDYQAVYYFFNHYKDDPEVIRLMYIYVHADCFYRVIGRPLYTIKYSGYNVPNCSLDSAYKYVRYVYERYKVLPAKYTVPMVELRKRFRRIRHKRVTFKEEEKYEALELYKLLHPFIRELIELGCPDDELLKFIVIEKKKSEQI